MTRNKAEIFSADVEWQDNALPVSTQFDDLYYSRVDGQAETRHVFIDGNGLIDRFQVGSRLTIAELGFGTGLNFLETLRAWEEAEVGTGFDFVSFERYPMTRKDLAKALRNWTGIEENAEHLISNWQTDEDHLKVAFGDTHLSLYFGDANEILPRINLAADAWFLDGFSPAKNPELWNGELMREVYGHTSGSGTFATYAAAGWVRENLEKAGFEVARRKGFGTKRHMTVGQRPD